MTSVLKKELDEYPGYIIYSDGRIFSKITNVFMTHHKQGGYYVVSLRISNNKSRNVRVHRLLALAFVENSDPNNKKIVDHIDGNKTNNNIKNLNWVTH
jgi:hypothetical protein